MSDAVSVSLDVEVTLESAFDVFTRELDAWWGRGPKFRFLAPYDGALILEPGVGGRLLHVADAEAGRVFVVGHVTRVDIRFEPVPEGTRVIVTHSGWDALAPEHPARHGFIGREFVLWKGRWWGELLTAAKQHTERRHSAASHEGGRP